MSNRGMAIIIAITNMATTEPCASPSGTVAAKPS